ncbi:MAG: Lrp/AsnC family transcriptional regulator [Flavobacteriaceae bacterium]
MKLDSTDKQLLTLLQQDSNTSINVLAEKVNLTKTPIYQRIKSYLREGVIKKYVAILDRSQIDSLTLVFCSVSLENQKLVAIEQFKAAIEDIPEVIECYLMGGANDFLLKVAVRDLQTYNVFSSGKLATLPNVSQIKSTFVLEEVKCSTVIPVH